MRHSCLASSSVLGFAILLAACGGNGPSSEDPGNGSGSTGQTSGGSGSGSSSGPSASGPGVVVDGQTVPVAKSTEVRDKAADVSASDLAGAVTSNNAFAVDLYGQLRTASASSNLLTSPLSASIALTMTYGGAEGTTATQMATALHLGSDASSVFAGQNALSQALASRAAAALANDQEAVAGSGQPAPSPSDYVLQVVNSVWGETGYPWKAPFLGILAADYGTGVYEEDFATSFDPARLLINDWVADETADKIENLLPEGSLTKQTRMVLVNAVHVKLPWQNPFDVSATAPASFTTGAGTTVSTPFMNQTTTFPYVDDGNAQIVGLPLANNQVAVVVALPHGDLATYEAGLTASSAGLAMPASQALVQLAVPKVSFTSPSFSLADALKTLGMPIAFDQQNANFQGICVPPDGQNLYISDVLQKAMIAMQETGVEAAAATAVIVGETDAAGGPTPTPIPVVVNRPYVISIVDVPTGAVLFLGHITDPTATGG
jgi:serpin B